jgi:hypothetical protein
MTGLLGNTIINLTVVELGQAGPFAGSGLSVAVNAYQ